MLRGFVITASIIIILLSAGWGLPVEGKKLDKGLTEEGFLNLFNGRDFTGWDGDPNFWSVKDGIIIARVSPGISVKNHSYLIWQGGKVRDFELRLKLRSTVGNSGIDYRANHVPTDRDGQPLKWTIKGYQSDIAEGWMGSLYNWGKPGAQPGQFVVVSGDENVTKSVGSVVDKDVLYKSGYYKPQQWNEYTVIARGSHILQRINGLPVVEFIDNSRDARRHGLLGLQVHAGRGPFLNEFKDIRVKQFKTGFGQARILFNGRDFTGWTFSSDEDKDKWSVENNLLVNKPGSQGHPIPYISTKDGYTNYVLRFQYRRRGDNETAVLLRFAEPLGAHPRGIRIYGKGGDFNRLGGIGDFVLKLSKIRSDMPAFTKLPPGFWNECEIILNKGQLDVKVNGVLRAKAADCEQTPGKIAFEGGKGRAEYRNMVLIPILPGKGR